MTLIVASAARATVGRRSSQQDAYLVPPEAEEIRTARGERYLGIVADGMGGHAAGEVASAIVTDAFADCFLGQEPSAGAAVDDGVRLDQAITVANSALASASARDPRLSGMGSTIIAASIDREGLRWASVGDSLLLLYRYPNVMRLNADHSLGALLDEQARRGQISEAEAAGNPRRHALRSALTGRSIDLRDIEGRPFEILDGDWIILASDGILSLSGDEISDIAYAHRDDPAAVMAESFIRAVEAKGRSDQDNTTVIAIAIKTDPDAQAIDSAGPVANRLTLQNTTASEDDDGSSFEDPTRRVVQPMTGRKRILRGGDLARAADNLTGWRLVLVLCVMFGIGLVLAMLG